MAKIHLKQRTDNIPHFSGFFFPEFLPLILRGAPDVCLYDLQKCHQLTTDDVITDLLTSLAEIQKSYQVNLPLYKDILIFIGSYKAWCSIGQVEGCVNNDRENKTCFLFMKFRTIGIAFSSL